jgi:tetratricopeptide (TPR) repeat protein
MAESAKQPFTPQQAHQALEILERAGLTRRIESTIFQLHPALTRFLRARGNAFAQISTASDAWLEKFVGFMALLADTIMQESPRDQNAHFRFFGESIERAHALSAKNDSFELAYSAMTQFMGVFAQNRRDFKSAQRHFEALTLHSETHDRKQLGAVAWHRLGLIAEWRGDFDIAEQMYLKSLAISESIDSESVADTYHQLGMLSHARLDLESADRWCRKALDADKRRVFDYRSPSTLHELGRIAQAHRDYDTARRFFLDAIELKKRRNDVLGMAVTYRQFGTMCQEQGDLDTAEQCYRRSQ